MEQKLEIHRTTGKNGKEYANIDLRELADGNFITFEKTFIEGRKVTSKYGDSFSVGVKYNDELVSFWLNKDSDHTTFKETGGIGDIIKLSVKEEIKTNPKLKKKYVARTYTFEKV